MSCKYLPCKLSVIAETDLEEIYDYTFEKFGEEQAIAYLTAFDALFDNLSQNAVLGRKRNEIRFGLRSIAKDNHIFFTRLRLML